MLRAAYTHYIERIGRAPGPMLDDYDQVVRDHRAYVVEASADIIGVLVLMDKEDGIILDNVAILPFRYRRFDISRSQYAAACDYHARSRTRSVR